MQRLNMAGPVRAAFCPDCAAFVLHLRRVRAAVSAPPGRADAGGTYAG